MSTTDSDPTKHKTGAEGDASADTKAPFAPRDDDDTPVGDTDQHSKVAGGKGVPAESGARKTDNAAND